MTTNTDALVSVERLTPLAALELVCGDIFDRWDKGQRSGRLLAALSGRLRPGYDPRVDLIRQALSNPSLQMGWEGEPALREATSLAWALFNQHYRFDEAYTSGRVKWSPLPDLRGVISQIDNMTTGLTRLTPSGVEGETVPSIPADLPRVCDGKEQDAFEVWAKANRYDMETHPLHWLFLNERTWAARDGWKAGLTYAAKQVATPKPSTTGETVPSIPAGMVPWEGGDAAPADWDGGPVLWADGDVDLPASASRKAWRGAPIIAYTPKPSTTGEAVPGDAAAWVNSIPGVKPSDQFIAADRRALESMVARALAKPSTTGASSDTRHGERIKRVLDEAGITLWGSALDDLVAALTASPKQAPVDQGEVERLRIICEARKNLALTQGCLDCNADDERRWIDTIAWLEGLA